MTDNEIVKALECCIENTKCGECPMFRTPNCMNKVFGYALDLINRKDAEIINRTEEYNDMLEQRNKVEEALEVMTMDVNSLTSERDALQEMVKEQKAEIERLNVELVGMRGACESYKIHYDNAQAEIERLKDDKNRLEKIMDNLSKELDEQMKRNF